ncbi:MAG TPA: glycosyltransferase family 2 protein [Desulfomonilaceae bacterium]|nr:glycosyltransferase family 2 protein [Desulfomonilaceae bacterium]
MNWFLWAGIGFSVFILVELIRLNIMLYEELKVERHLPAWVTWDRAQPPVSVIIPAKDEEQNIEPAVRSVLASDYDRLQVILVNDRSLDSTGPIMARLAREDPRIQVLSIRELPEDWTGKTHAMYRAAERADGDILLFTDADAVFDRQVLSRAARFFVDEHLDMLCLLPGFTERRFGEKVVYPHLALGFSYFHPLSKVNDPSRTTAMASGCFLMISKRAYLQLGTWERLRNEVTEDVALSRVVKAARMKFRLLRGSELVRTQPFDGVAAVCRFWRRTFYGGLQKSIPKILRLAVNYTAIALLSALVVWSGALWFTGPPSLAVSLLFTLSSLAMAAVIVPFCFLLRQDGVNWIHGLTTPIGIIISAWVAWSTLIVVITNRGIRWRGKVYR